LRWASCDERAGDSAAQALCSPRDMSESKKGIWSVAIAAFEDGAHAVLEQACRRFLALEPENFPARMLLAHALLKMKRFGEAADLLEGADPDDERAVVLWHRTAGDYYGERGDYQSAEDEYASALAIADQPTSDLVLDLVEARINQGHNEAAVRALDTFMSRREGQHEAPGDDDELLAFAKGRALRNLGRYEEALISAKQALALGEVFPAAEALVLELEQRIELEAAAVDLRELD
jgi:tetratricopeptide (TPR) repeat protein